MKQLLLAATLALSLATPASAAVQTADRIVAVINNGVITLSELQQREAEITASLKRQNVALPPASVLSRQVLDLMVNEQLQLQYAASNGLRVKSDDLDSLQSRVGSLFGRSLELSNGMKAQPYVKASYITEHAGSSKVSVNGSNVDLTSYEYKVLEYLMMHAGELVSKADLTEHIYQQDFDRDSNVLEVFIGRLRKKLDPDGELKPIETVRGRGYRFAIPRSGEG